MEIEIRQEEEADYHEVEKMVKRAFWNVYVPGASEHFILHKIRNCQAFIKELSLLAIVNGEIAGNIVYTASWIKGEADTRVITFGPLSVMPEARGQGIGGRLVRLSMDMAAAMGHRAIMVYGHPAYYERFGFVNSKRYNISAADGRFLQALLALELYEGALRGVSGRFFEDSVFGEMDEREFLEFDKKFPQYKKKRTASQVEFLTLHNLEAN